MIRRFVGRRAKLRFSRKRWRQLIIELGRRSGGTRESGAFLLSPRASDGRTITKIVYFDDLDPGCLTGAITLSGSAYPPLWDLCDQYKLRVVGDVHTHPGNGVTQSPIDQGNPMIARTGHISLIVPHLAQHPTRAAQVGLHQYLGDAGWHSSLAADASRSLYIGWWA